MQRGRQQDNRQQQDDADADNLDGNILIGARSAGVAPTRGGEITYAVTAGTYYVRVKHYDTTQTGAYQLVSSFTAAPTLAQALDTSGLTWTTGGNANWSGQTADTHDGVDAGQSGIAADNQESWVQTTVTGPGTLSFWWQVSSEATFDFLRFEVDGVEQFSISGAVAWQPRTFTIPSGNHILRWRYTKDNFVASGSDAGWVDEVVFTGSNANLVGLVLSTGVLTPAFSATTTSYTATVPYATNSLTVTPTVADVNATVKVNGITVVSGAASSAIALSVGANTITTVVTAQDGATTKTYTVVVTRETYYSSWATAHGVSGADSGLMEDFDHDGVTNLFEMAFGTNPALSSGGLITLSGASITQRGGPTTWMQNIANGLDYRALFGRRKDYVAAGLTYTVQFSGDLVYWQPSTDTPTVIGGDSEIDAVTVPYPFFINGRKARFFKVQVTSP